MKTFLTVAAFLFLSSSFALADIPSEIQCRNENGESLSWEMTILSLPEDGKAGEIEGQPKSLILRTSSQKMVDQSRAFSGRQETTYSSDEDFVLVEFKTNESLGIQSASLALYENLWDAFGSTLPKDQNRPIMGRGELTLTLHGGVKVKRTFSCAMVLTN